MATTEFVCPECHAKGGTAKAIPAGALIRCPKCSHVFRLGGSSPKAAAPPAAPIRREPPSSAPRREPPPVAAVRREADAPRSSRVNRRDVARDDDYEEDDRPQSGKRRKKKKESSSNMGLMIGLGLGALLLVVFVGVVVAVVALSGGKDADKVASVAKTYPLPGAANPPEPGNNDQPPPRPGGGAPMNPPVNNNPRNDPPTPPMNDPPPMVVNSGPPAGGNVGDVYGYVLKSTVLIVNIMQDGASIGTGTVIDAAERLILTNEHVVSGTTELLVFFPRYENGKLIAEKEKYLGTIKKGGGQSAEIPAEVLAADALRDLALLRVPKLPPGTEALPLAKNPVNVGQTIHSVGNAGVSGALWVYTQGNVRSVYRKKWISRDESGKRQTNHDSEVIETSSPTNPGDSGGPMVNDRGELVGVTEGFSAAGRAISLFISLNEARDFIEKEFTRRYAKNWSPVTRSAMQIRGGGGADVTSLINSLDSTDAKTRAAAARNLGEMGPDAKLAIRRLIKALKDPDELTSRVAAEALSKIGAPSRDDVSALATALKDPKPEVRRYAASAIGQIGPEAASVAPQLAEVLTDSDDRVRESLVRSLGNLGPSAKAAAVPELKKALDDGTKEVRVAAAAALTNLLTPPTADDVPVLVSILKHKDPEASVFGARALAKLGKQAKSAIPELIATSKGGDPAARRSAIDTLAAIGPDAKTAMPIYLAAIKDMSDNSVRQSGLLAIGHLAKEMDKEKDKESVNAVLEAAQDQDPQVKKAAWTAAGKLGALIPPAGAKQFMPGVIDALQGKDANVRDQALEAVAGLGPVARDAIPALITMMEKQDIKLFVNDKEKKVYLQESDEAFLDKIAKTLGKVGLPAVRPLLRSLDSTNLNFGLIIGARRALGEIGPPAKDAVGSLQVISLSSLPPPVCFEADRAVRKIRAK